MLLIIVSFLKFWIKSWNRFGIFLLFCRVLRDRLKISADDVEMHLNLIYQEYGQGESRELVSESNLLQIFNRCRNPYQFAVHVARMLFTPEELRDSNCRGVKDKHPLDKRRLHFIKCAVMKYYNVLPKYETNIWKQCMQSIDTRCRHERRLLNLNEMY